MLFYKKLADDNDYVKCVKKTIYPTAQTLNL